MSCVKPVYKRILLKLSGEALAKDCGKGEILNYDFVNEVCGKVKKCVEIGVQVAVVVGGGNIWRGGRQGANMNRSRADHMGMLATVINSLALQQGFAEVGCDAVVMTAIDMERIAEPFTQRNADKYLAEGKVVIFGGGTGCPYFSTDTGAVLRAAEIGADAILMAKNIDGVYSADPKVDPNAVKLDEITYVDVLKNGLKAIDWTAASFGLENKLTIQMFGLDDPENIVRVVTGEKIGTVLK